MTTAKARSGEIVDVRQLGEALAFTKNSTLILTGSMKVVRMVLPAGKVLAEHTAPGEIAVQCLEGEIAFAAHGKTERLKAGQLLYLAAGEPHSVTAITDSSFLLTVVLN